VLSRLVSSHLISSHLISSFLVFYRLVFHCVLIIVLCSFLSLSIFGLSSIIFFCRHVLSLCPSPVRSVSLWSWVLRPNLGRFYWSLVVGLFCGLCLWFVILLLLSLQRYTLLTFVCLVSCAFACPIRLFSDCLVHFIRLGFVCSGLCPYLFFVHTRR
jgi:hypothetical protein